MEKLKTKINNFLNRIHKFIYGWAKLDCYDIDTWFINTFTPMLNYYKKIITDSAVCPIGIKNHNEWIEILERMQFHLYMMTDENIYEKKNKELSQYNDAEKRDMIFSIKERNKKHFFELLEKHFFDLWY